MLATVPRGVMHIIINIVGSVLTITAFPMLLPQLPFNTFRIIIVIDATHSLDSYFSILTSERNFVPAAI